MLALLASPTIAPTEPTHAAETRYATGSTGFPIRRAPRDAASVWHRRTLRADRIRRTTGPCAIGAARRRRTHRSLSSTVCRRARLAGSVRPGSTRYAPRRRCPSDRRDDTGCRTRGTQAIRRPRQPLRNTARVRADARCRRDLHLACGRAGRRHARGRQAFRDTRLARSRVLSGGARRLLSCVFRTPTSLRPQSFRNLNARQHAQQARHAQHF